MPEKHTRLSIFTKDKDSSLVLAVRKYCNEKNIPVSGFIVDLIKKSSPIKKTLQKMETENKK